MNLRYILLRAVISLCVVAPHSLRAEDFKIGSILILSGNSSNYGYYSQRGLELAKEELNSKGGVRGKQIVIQYEDEIGSSARAALTGYRNLRSTSGVRYIVGPSWQDAVQALTPLAEKDNVVLISPSTPVPTNVGISTWPDPEIEAAALGSFIAQRYHRIAILSTAQAWETQVDQSLKSTLERLAAAVVFHSTPPPDTTSVGTEILKLKESRPDAVMISSYALFPMYIKELARQKVDLPRFGIELDGSALSSVRDLTNGVQAIGPSTPSANFIAAYQARYKEMPDIPAANAYDALTLLVSAINSVGDDPTLVRARLASTQAHAGASGVISIEAGKCALETKLFVVKNGTLQSSQ